MPDWTQVLSQIGEESRKASLRARSANDTVRRRYLRALQRKMGRNIIAYYSGWLSKPDIQGTDLSDEDKNGFMMAIHNLPRAKGLDLILHTPGGSIAAAESIVDYLKRMFDKDIRAIVPQIAMSAGTMLACSCQSIIMGKQSNLGPVDPQMGNIPAAGVIEEFKRAYDEIVADRAKREVWAMIIGRYPPSYLNQCENAVGWAKDFVTRSLQENMFANDPDKDSKAAQIVMKLTDFSGNRAHERHINIDECINDLGLRVIRLEDDQELQDIVLTVHHCYMHTLTNTTAFKIIENHNGKAFIKQQVMLAVQAQAT